MYILPPGDERRHKDSHRVSKFYGGRTLFGEHVTYSKLASMISRGATVRKTRLTAEFGYEQWRRHYPAHATAALFAVDPASHIHWYTAEKQPEPKEEWTVYALNVPDEE